MLRLIQQHFALSPQSNSSSQLLNPISSLPISPNLILNLNITTATMQLLSTLLFLAPALASPIAPRDEPTCGQKSGKLSEWTLTDFDFHASYIFTTPAHQNSWGYVSFNVSNPVLDYTVSCSAASSRLNDFFYGEMVYDCKAPEGESATTSFTFSRPDGALALNQSWTCNDDPKYP